MIKDFRMMSLLRFPKRGPGRVSAPVMLLLLCFGFALPTQAYPPTPYHLFFGMVRDQYGTPLDLTSAEVVLETSSGVRVKTRINPGIETAANYRLEVPMDSGLTAAPYQATALRPTAPFRIKVTIGGNTYVPIEMGGDYAQLGKPSQRTRLDLTLGEDSDGDGLPDAWERLINPDISKVQPGGSAGNGLTYAQTYYAGTYAVSPEDGFSLSIVGFNQGAPLLEFLAVDGRTYTVFRSPDAKTWQPVSFRIPAEGTNAVTRANYRATAVKKIQVEVLDAETSQPQGYFRLMLQ